MRRILLINPNTSTATTAMMVEHARSALADGWEILGLTARRGAAMITTEAELAVGAEEVEALAETHANGAAGIITAAFGDPALERLRARFALPVTGLCAASVLAAARGGMSFGIATVTPDLAETIAAKVRALGLSARLTGICLTEGDPRALAADPAWLDAALAEAVGRCRAQGAARVIIGGGPLTASAIRLAKDLPSVIVVPVAAAVAAIVGGCAFSDQIEAI
jgi:Asp/Glu/hydantoin racemase